MATDGSVGTHYGPDDLRSRVLTAVGNMVGHSLVFMVYLMAALLMTTGNFGEFYYLLAVALLVSTFVTAGLPRLSQKLTKQKKWQSKLKRSELFLNSLVMAVLLYVVVAPFLIWTHPGEVLPGMVIIRYSAPMLYAGVIIGRFQRKKVLVSFILRNALILLGLLILELTMGLQKNRALFSVVFFGWFATFGLEFLWRSGVKFKLSLLSISRCAWLSKKMMPYWMRSVASGLFIAGPPIVLFWRAGTHEVAVYGLAFTYVLLVGVIPSAIVSLGLPWVMRLERRKRGMRLLAISGGIGLNCMAFLCVFVLFQEQLLSPVLGDLTIAPGFMAILTTAAVCRWLRKPFSTQWSAQGMSPWLGLDVFFGAGVLALVLIVNLIFGPTVESMAWAYLAGWATTLLVTIWLYVYKLFRGPGEIKAPFFPGKG